VNPAAATADMENRRINEPVSDQISEILGDVAAGTGYDLGDTELGELGIAVISVAALGSKTSHVPEDTNLEFG
jgi:hypothetical protein